MVVDACNPSTLGGRGRWISEFEASLVYRVSSRTASATQRKLSRKIKTKTNKQKTQLISEKHNLHHCWGCWKPSHC